MALLYPELPQPVAINVRLKAFSRCMIGFPNEPGKKFWPVGVQKVD